MFTPMSFLNSKFVFNDTVSSSMQNYNLRTRAIAAGWNGVSPLNATIVNNSGVYIWSDTTATPAFATGSIPAESSVRLTNNGYIMGRGGNGAVLGGANVSATNGGNAMNIEFDLTLDNTSGFILGGGGGGGGVFVDATSYVGGGGGAGGGTGGHSRDFSAGISAGTSGGAVGANAASPTAQDSATGDIAVGGEGGGRVHNGGSTSGPVCNDGNPPSLPATAPCGGAGGILVGEGATNATGGTGAANTAAGGNGSATLGGGTIAGAGGGGGGFGQSGGAGASTAGGVKAAGSGGKAINLNGKTVTWLGGSSSPNVLGAVS